MKNTFKKMAASIIAVASLTVSATGIVTSAEDVTTPVTPEVVEEYNGPTGYVSFGDGATAGIYRDSSLIFLDTQGGSNNSHVSVKLVTAGYDTIDEEPGTTHAGTGYVSRNYRGSGIVYATGLHTADGAEQGTAR